MNDAQRLIRELPQGLIRWYDFTDDSEILFTICGREEYDVLSEVFPGADTVALDQLDTLVKQYDYIIGMGVIDQSPAPETTLHMLKQHMKANGELLIFAENRLAVKHFCGEKDLYSKRIFDGIDNYVYFSKKAQELAGGREYSRSEIADFLNQEGLKYQFYSVFPALERPQMIIADDYLPRENLDIRIFPQYQSPDTVFLEEERLYDELSRNGLLHGMANGFFIVCSLHEKVNLYNQITVSPDRGHENALATILKKDGTVVKRALYPEGQRVMRQLLENNEYLKEHHVPMVDVKLENHALVMPCIQEETALSHFRKLFRENLPAFLKELDLFWEYIKCSSEHVDYREVNWEQFEPGWEKRKEDDPTRDKWRKLAEGTKQQREEIGVILKRGYVDLIALNCFYDHGEFLFYDQETYVENFPAKAILLRTIDTIYMKQPGFEQIYSMEDMLDYFGLKEHAAEWRKFAWNFLEPLRNEKALASYHKTCRRDYYVVRANRQRMNYSQENYDNYFSSIFKNIYGKKIYLFGSGRYTKRFLDKYGDQFEIAGLIDNAVDKWGKQFEGYEIFPPEHLQTINVPFKVFICIKDYQEVLDQLLAAGVKEIAVFSPLIEYELPRKEFAVNDDNIQKTYDVGYIAGVFDLFHIGHLNMFRRAKEQCRHLIVGVVSDEQVMREKRTMPVIPFEERLEIVKSCRYVDEAVEISIDKPSTEDAYRKYHFDVQFSGSDYEHDPSWLSQRTYLQQHGADMVFFPYTQSESSTKIKQKLNGNEDVK